MLEDLIPNQNESIETEEKSFDVLSGDDTAFVENAITQVPGWAKSSAVARTLGQFNLTNNRAFQILASRIKKVS